MALTTIDNNPVNESVTFIREQIPFLLQNIGHIYVKYTKLISQKYLDLSVSDERKRIRGVQELQSLLLLSFDKLLFALDKDYYIDFLNELKTLGTSVYKTYDADINRDNNVLGDSYIRVDSINFKFLINPYNQLKKFENNIWFPNKIPLIVCEPNFIINGEADFLTSRSHTHNNKLLYQNDIEGTKLGLVNYTDCSISIDISSLFDIITYELFCNYYRYKNMETYLLEMKDKCDIDENLLVNDIVNVFSGPMIYSAVTTYLATVNKVYSEKIDIFNMIGNDILNSCRHTIFDNFDTERDSLKTGMGLRHMTIEISNLLNAVADTSTSYQKDEEFTIIRLVIEYLMKLKYKTYNYLYVPANNLKQKKLVMIGKLAQPMVHLLSEQNRSELRVCLNTLDKEPRYIDAFLSREVAITNGTFALDKRLYDHGKDFIDVFSKFILIKKRMHEVGSLNTGDGTPDKIGKSYSDYKTFLKLSYAEIKQSLTNIFNRIKSITIGRRYITYNIMNQNTGDERVVDANKIAYGVNVESIVGSSNNGIDIYNYNDSVIGVDYTKQKKYYLSINERIHDIIKIYNTVLKDRTCTYADGNYHLNKIINEHGNGSLIHLWLQITQSVHYFIDTPFEQLHYRMGTIATEYAVKSINEMAPTSALYNPTTFRDKQIEQLSYQNKIETEYKSVEDLRMAFESVKEEIEQNEDGDESIFGGMLFSDFGGVPLAQEMTAKESELFDEYNIPRNANDPELKAFEDLRREFDLFIAKNI